MLAIGGVFALTAGVLDITGRLQVGGGMLDVVWGTPLTYVTAVPVTVPPTTPNAVTADLIANPNSQAPAGANQRVSIEVNFPEPRETTARISIPVVNRGTLPARLIAAQGPDPAAHAVAPIITFEQDPNVIGPVGNLGGLTAADWQITATVDWSGVFGAQGDAQVLAPRHITDNYVVVEIHWTGHIPAGATMAADGSVSASFLLEFAYQQALPTQPANIAATQLP